MLSIYIYSLLFQSFKILYSIKIFTHTYTFYIVQLMFIYTL
jgi:hypothetical protein